MGNCCRGESSGEDLRATRAKNHPHAHREHSDGVAENDPHRRDQKWRLHGENGASSSSSSSTRKSSYSSKGGGFREVKIRMTKKELEELVGWLNMADSSFEQVMAGLVNVISDQRGDEDENDGEVARLRHQRSWRPSLQSIPEII